jgi:hypothetical protein
MDYQLYYASFWGPARTYHRHIQINYRFGIDCPSLLHGRQVSGPPDHTTGYPLTRNHLLQGGYLG